MCIDYFTTCITTVTSSFGGIDTSYTACLSSWSIEADCFPANLTGGDHRGLRIISESATPHSDRRVFPICE